MTPVRMTAPTQNKTCIKAASSICPKFIFHSFSLAPLRATKGYFTFVFYVLPPFWEKDNAAIILIIII